MDNLFQIVGDNFFKPLTSKYKTIYWDCLQIIHEAYRCELSYGLERELIVRKLTDYFEDQHLEMTVEEDSSEILRDARAQASKILRDLRDCGWLEQEIDSDTIVRLMMPGPAVTVMETLSAIVKKEEREYQSDIAAIYSLLTNRELRSKPYTYVLRPAHERTEQLFSELKKLNTDIKKHIDELTADQSAEQILEGMVNYNEQIGFQAYHRIKTIDNVARFRTDIVAKLKEMMQDHAQPVWVNDYCNIYPQVSTDEAAEEIQKQLAFMIEQFSFYDDIIAAIDRRHNRYLRSAVARARFLLQNTSDLEGKINALLRSLTDELKEATRTESNAAVDDVIAGMIQIFPHYFIDESSLRSVPMSRKITKVEPLAATVVLDKAQRNKLERELAQQYSGELSARNVRNFVAELLKQKAQWRASEIPVNDRLDAVRLMFIYLYGGDPASPYQVERRPEMFSVPDFSFQEFIIRATPPTVANRPIPRR